MQNRLYKRYSTNLRGVIIFDGKKYPGNLSNVSEEGIAYCFPNYIKKEAIIPKKTAKLFFSPYKEAVLSLDCEIRWYKGPSINSSKSFLGLKIINPPENHKNYVRSLV